MTPPLARPVVEKSTPLVVYATRSTVRSSLLPKFFSPDLLPVLPSPICCRVDRGTSVDPGASTYDLLVMTSFGGALFVQPVRVPAVAVVVYPVQVTVTGT